MISLVVLLGVLLALLGLAAVARPRSMKKVDGFILQV